jgi:hypothetical protein
MNKVSIYLIILFSTFCLKGVSQCFTSNPPSVTITSVTTSSISISWNNVGGSSQRVKVTPLTGPLAGIPFATASIMTLTYTISTGLTPGTLYKIEVWGHVNFCAGGFPLDSEIGEVAIYTIASPPTNLATSNIGASSFRATWTASTGASQGYLLDVSTNNVFSSFVGVYHDFVVGVNATFIDITSLPATGTNYYYRLRAKNSGGTSAYSSGINSALTLPATPTFNSPTNIAGNSFIANWQTSIGASSYTLDVSINNLFSPKVTHQITGGTIDNFQVPNLNSGVTYFYRIMASNSSGDSPISSTSSLTTTFSAPTISSIIPIDANSFQFTWNISASTSGVTGYRIDVSENNMFTSFVNGYENLLVQGQTKTISGLSSGTIYFFRVRAVGASSNSPNSTTANTLTIPSPPNLGVAAITSTGFTASWNNLPNVLEYLIDIANDQAFTSILSSFNNKSVSSSSISISGLTPGTSYFCRIRSRNSSGTSTNSTPVITVLTAPTVPLVFDKSSISPTSISVNWTSVPTATEYDLYVYRDQDFLDGVEGFNPLVVTHPMLTANIIGLNPATIYYLRIRARNAPDYGSEFKTISATTLLPGGGSSTPEIKNVVFPDFFVSKQTKEISAVITGGVGDLTVSLSHRTKSEENFIKDNVPLIDGSYKIAINEFWFDDFGMEFYLEAKDANQTIRDLTHSILSGVSNVKIPLSSFGKTQENYQVISIPYSLDDNHINNSFEKVMGTYNKKNWRFSHYSNGRLIDYENGLSANLITQGLSYWFISKDEVSLDLGAGKSYGNSIVNPFIMQLKKGWNQIGNPFPFDISWQEVMSANGNLNTVSTLYTYKRENRSFIEDDLLKVYSGGFVFAEEATDLNFPVNLSKQSGGRIATQIEFSGTGLNDWFLPIQLKQNGMLNTMSGIGMHGAASDGKDIYDRITLPHFFDYVELSSSIDSYSYKLARNIFKTKNREIWNLKIESNSNENVELIWDSNYINNLNGELLLYDKSQGTIINMAETDKVSTKPNASLSIYFNADKTWGATKSVILGRPSPNPFREEVSIPIDYTIKGQSRAVMQIINLQGVVLVEKEIRASDTGLLLAQWNGFSAAGVEASSGLYIFRIIGTDEEGEKFNYTGKIIKQ